MSETLEDALIADRLAVKRDDEERLLARPEESLLGLGLRLTRARRAPALLLFLLSVASLARAEVLPLRTYTTADGLAHDSVNKIVRDPRGFLWFCTAEGLSRFDGYQFTNYGAGEGLPHQNVTDLLVTRAGEYWIATYGGLVRFDPRGLVSPRLVSASEASAAAPPMFATVTSQDPDRRARAVSAIFEGRGGTIWVGTRNGLYRLESSRGRWELRPVEIGLPADSPDQRFVWDVLEDRRGSLWVATPAGLYRRFSDGTAVRYTERDGLPDSFFHDLMEDHEGRLWAATRYGGFFRFAADETRAAPVIEEAHREPSWIFQLLETSDRGFWAATNVGLVELAAGRPAIHGAGSGFPHHEILALAEDAAGNLWLGTTAGAAKLSLHGFVTYGEPDGILTVNALFEDRAGAVCLKGSLFAGRREGVPVYYLGFRCLDQRGLAGFRPGGSFDFGWAMEHAPVQTPGGEWWAGGNGLYRFSPSESFTRTKSARPFAVYTTENGLPSMQVFRLFADAGGNVWVSTIGGSGVARWDRASQRWLDLSNAPGLPPPRDDLARCFGEDQAGNVWIGFSTGVARFRQGAFAFFTANDGLPAGAIQNILADRLGRLWMASASSGLIRVDHPADERPGFASYTAAQGLSSNVVTALVEDAEGRIYAGTGRGLDRLDPETGRIKHYTTADGLAPGEILAAFRDRQGQLWIATRKGLSRFAPAQEPSPQAPPILITNVRVAGERRPISALGEAKIALPDLAPDRREVEIEFVALGFATGEVLRYQYRLEGGGAEWSAPSAQRTINFANLAPGRYRFLARAVNSDGLVSPSPAAVTFAVLRPAWQRPRFLALITLAAALVGYALYRRRIARLVELERVRTRIASDLHDDIGAGLSRIAVLSEVAGHEAGGSEVAGRLHVIAAASRELVDSMSDIVWAVNPARDQLRDLVQRMRRFASDLFTSRGIAFTFRAPSDERRLKIGADVRRHVLLIFKESVNNIARHSRCARAEIELAIEGGRLVLRVRDDGLGFDPSVAADGNGLTSMRQRARLLDGRLDVDSGGGRGTTITLSLPLGATVKDSKGRLRGSMP